MTLLRRSKAAATRSSGGPYGGTSANTILVTPRGFVGAADPRTRVAGGGF